MRKLSHMIKKNLATGRIAQKMKTRERLLIAANNLMVKGNVMSIEQVAKEAGTSKATAYRYFSNIDTLRKESSLHTISQDKEDLFSGLSKDDLEGRLKILIQYHFKILTKNEVEFRLYLSAVLQDSVQDKESYTRAGRRILLIEEALVSLKKTYATEQFNKIVSAISVILGIESITILKDLCGLKNAKILETWKWMIDKIILDR